jgi:hypothetical protein
MSAHISTTGIAVKPTLTVNSWPNTGVRGIAATTYILHKRAADFEQDNSDDNDYTDPYPNNWYPDVGATFLKSINKAGYN